MPRSSVPSGPLIVRPAPSTFPVNVAVPADFVINTVPVVVKEPMLCVAVPDMVTPPVVPLTVPPLLMRSPFKVSKNDDIDRFAPLLIVSGEPALKTLAALKVIVPEFEMITPPVAVNGVIHSGPAGREVDVLY